MPLVVILHGVQGSLANHYDTALALADANLLVGAISDCQRAGLVRADEPAADLALTAWSSVHGLSALLVEGVLDRPAHEVAEMVTRDLFLGLGPRSVSQRPG